MEEIVKSKIESFLRKTGKRGAAVISVLGKNEQFINAISTPLGEELLRDVIVIMEEKLELIYNEKASTEDKADFRALKRISERWVGRINQQRKLTDVIKTT